MKFNAKKRVLSLALASVFALSTCPLTGLAQGEVATPISVEEKNVTDLISKEEAAVISKENNMPVGQLYDKPLVTDEDIKEVAKNNIYDLLNMEGHLSHYLVLLQDGYSVIDAKQNGQGFLFTSSSTDANKVAEKVKQNLPLYFTPSYKILTKEELDREVQLQEKRDKERSKPKQVEVLYNSVNINLNGHLLDMDNLLYKSTTYVPLRDIAKVSGAEVRWDGASHTANYLYDEETKQKDPIEKGKLEFSKRKLEKRSLILLVDHVKVQYNGKTHPQSLGSYDENNELFPSVPTLLYEGKTYVPLRFMTLVNKQTVSWDQDTYTASVYNGEEK